MSMTLTARFSTRRDAEMAIERLVQEHGVDRRDLSVRAEGQQNTSGQEVSGSDHSSGPPTTEAREDAALNGAVLVSMNGMDEAARTKVEAAFREFGVPLPDPAGTGSSNEGNDAGGGKAGGVWAEDPRRSGNWEADRPGRTDDSDVPGRQSRPMTKDEKLDKSLEDTFPTSDPVPASRIDGPNN